MNQVSPQTLVKGLKLFGIGVMVAGLGNLLSPLLLLIVGMSVPGPTSLLSMITLTLTIIANFGVFTAGLGVIVLARDLASTQRRT